MTAKNRQPTNTGRSTSAEAATTPHELVLVLFEGLRMAVNEARVQMQLHETAAKGAAIGKACEIIDGGLKASLDMERGGKIAEQLQSLYDYMVERLTLANLRNEPAHLDVVARLLAEIEGAWRQIGPQQTSGMPSRA